MNLWIKGNPVKGEKLILKEKIDNPNPNPSRKYAQKLKLFLFLFF